MNWLFPRPFFRINEPRTDIENKPKTIEITAEMPGINQKDIKISIEKNRIEIKAEQKEQTEIKKKNFYRQERSYTGLYRAFNLPTAVNPKKAKTTLKNGLLKIVIQKEKTNTIEQISKKRLIKKR